MEALLCAPVTQRSFDARIARVAAAQHGVVSRAQAARAGGTRRMVQHRVAVGRWEALGHGVFRVAGSPATRRQSLMAAGLAWGAGSAISHGASAALWRLPGFEEGVVEATVPRGSRGAGPGVVYRKTLSRREVVIVDAIRVTTLGRTLLDLATVAPRDRLEEALDDALRRRLVSLGRMRAHLAEWARGRRAGVATVRALLSARDVAAEVPQSVFETRLLRLVARSRLPEPARQHAVRERGRIVAVLDFAYPDARFGIEADGFRWHSGRLRWEHDRARQNHLTLLGWRILHVTWAQLAERPTEVVASIRRGLAATAR